MRPARLAKLSPRAFAALLLLVFVLSPSSQLQAQGLGSMFKPKGTPANAKIGDSQRGGVEMLQKNGWTLIAAHGGIDVRTTDKRGQTLRLTCDRAVFWSPPRDRVRKRSDNIQAIYAEGKVLAVFEQNGQDRIRVEAERCFFNLQTGRALILGARFRIVAADPDKQASKFEREPLYYTAKQLSIFGASEMIAKGVTITSCNFADPHFRVRASRCSLTIAGEPIPSAVAALGGGAAVADFTGQSLILEDLLETDQAARKQALGSDRLKDVKDSPRWIKLEDATVEAKIIPFAERTNVPLFYLPTLIYKSTWDLIPRVRFGSSRVFGTFGALDWSVPVIAPDKVWVNGKKKRHGVSASVQVGAGYSSERGFSQRGGARWKVYDKGEQAARGKFEADVLQDQGRDQSGAMQRYEDRSWIRLAQQLNLTRDWRLDTELSKLSDRGYLLEFEERIFKTEKQQENYLYSHYRNDNWFATALGRVRLNDFQNYVERLPEVTLDLLSQPLFHNPYIGGGSTLSWGMSASALRLRPDHALFATPTEKVHRLDSSLEVDHKIPLGPLVFRGFAGGRFTAVDHGTTRSGGLERFSSNFGANLATTFWRRFGSKSMHVFVPEVGYFNRFFNTREPGEFVQIDEVDQVRETEFLFLRARNRWSVFDSEAKKYYDLIDFVLEAQYFPKANKDNPGRNGEGRNFQRIFGDLRLYLPDILSFRTRLDADPSKGDILSTESFVSWFLTKDLTLGASYRNLKDVSEALGWTLQWNINPKWAIRLAEQYDFRTEEFLTHQITVRRRYHRFALDFSINIDPGEDDVSFSVQLAPDIFGSGQDPFGGGRLSGRTF